MKRREKVEGRVDEKEGEGRGKGGVMEGEGRGKGGVKEKKVEGKRSKGGRSRGKGI